MMYSYLLLPSSSYHHQQTLPFKLICQYESPTHRPPVSNPSQLRHPQCRSLYKRWNQRRSDSNVGVTVADARVSAEEVERGFVSDGSKKTYHEKLAQFTFYLALNIALNAYICSHFRRAIWPKEHRQNN